jgi:tetratricopeptide (TPR) repeat protein
VASAATILFAILLGVEVTRLTVASAVADTRPELASRLAPLAPATLKSLAMAEVGEAAAKGADPSQATLDRFRDLATAAPLRPEPFLVEAALAERREAYDRAVQLLIDARQRDPRSVAARYLLADVYLRQGKAIDGLRQMAILTRLIPAATVQLIPALSEYAHTPGAREKLAMILRDNPQLRQPLLAALSADPDNADLVVTLAGPSAGLSDPNTRTWQLRLLLGFIERKDYDRAYALWRQFAGAGEGPRPLLFNGDFMRIAAPPPFNWALLSSSAGVAEADNGRLRVLYYGRENALLASQVLLLPPGSYKFEASASGQVASGALVWTLQCSSGHAPLMRLQVGASVTQAVTFVVPSSGCDAQALQLDGLQQDMPQDTDVQIGPARIERIGD